MTHLKRKSSLLLLVVIAISFGIYYYIFYTLQLQNLQDTQNQYFAKVQNSFYKNQELHLKERYLQEMAMFLDEEIISYFATKNREKLIQSILPIFNKRIKHDPYLELIHFHSKDGTSFLRLPNLEKYGDEISKSRKMISAIHTNHIVMSGFEHGVYGLSYRIAVPLFYDKEYIGALEIGISPKKILDHVNYFNNVDGMIRFYGTTPSMYFENFKDISLKELINHDVSLKNKQFVTHENRYIAIYSFVINGYNQDKIGDFIFYKDLTEPYEKFHNATKKVFINFLFTTFILYFLLEYIFRYYTQQLFHLYKKTNTILENQPNITILTNGNEILQANKKFFDFVGFPTISSFKTKYRCICDLFEPEEGYLQSTIGEIKWATFVAQNPDKTHLAKIKRNNNEYIFKVFVNLIPQKGTKDSNMVATFIDITQELFLQEKIQEKNLLIQQQSRLVAIADMIGNIAHQWRQPLSVIASASSGLRLKEEYGMMEKDDIKKTNETILQSTEFLTQTIDTFRNFFKNDQTKTTFFIKDAIQHTLSIIKASYDNYFIQLEENYDETITYYGNENLLSQVLLNILSNAKDALVSNEVQQKNVTIISKHEKNQIQIIIKDNAGGVPQDIIDKVFDQYFTTKESHGTGLGLFMSKEIIHKHFQGTLQVQNHTDSYGKGATFIISFEEKRLSAVL